MRADDGGIWGRVEWTATAAELIGRKEYRYLSPVLVYHPKTRQIVRLNGAGLVHTPNLYLKALASQETAMLPDKTKQKPGEGEMTDDATFAAMIAEMLGCPPDTPPKELFDKLKAKLAPGAGTEPDPAKFVPVATVQAMLAERNLSLATASEERATQKVAEALRTGHITPGMKDWATALCRSDEASFDRFLADTIPPFGHLRKATNTSGLPPRSRQDHAVSDLAAAICLQLGLKPDALNE